MSFDFYTDDSDEATFGDIEDFIRAPVSEGLRVDYKVNMPQDLGDTVTAFANTYGGLVFIGVAESGGVPTAVSGILKGSSDIKTRIVNHVASTTFPRLRPSVAVIDIPTMRTHAVVVIRSPESESKPHMYLPRDKISIRNNDKCEYADYAALERLFAARGASSDELGASTDYDFYVRTIEDDGTRGLRTEEYIRLWFEPLTRTELLIDRRVEGALENAIYSVGGIKPGVAGTIVPLRHGGHVDLEWTPPSGDGYFAWRLTERGMLGLATHAMSHAHKRIFLVDVIETLRIGFRIAQAFYSAVGRVGRFRVQLLAGFGKAAIVPGASCYSRVVTGVGPVGPSKEGDDMGPHAYWDVMDHASLDNCAGVIASALLIALRAQRNASIDWATLVADIEQLTLPSGP